MLDASTAIESYIAQFPPEEHEIEALGMLVELRERFRWAGVVFSRVDVESHLERTVSDEEWDAISGSGEWTHMSDHLVEEGWCVLAEACDNAEAWPADMMFLDADVEEDLPDD